MPRLAEIQSRLVSIGELLDVVGAMRALAAVRMRQALGSLEAIRGYAAAIGDAIARARTLVSDGPLQSPRGGRRALVVFATEHGFAGALNDRLLDRAAAEAHGDELLVIGSRGALVASERRLAVGWSTPMASHAAGVPGVARRIAVEISRRVAGAGLERVDVVYGRAGTTAAPAIARDALLPPDLARFTHADERVPPLHHLAPAALLERLGAELLLAELLRMAVESLAAENAARLHAMSAARENVERKLAELRLDEHRARQDEVTMELLDVVTGAEALRRR